MRSIYWNILKLFYEGIWSVMHKWLLATHTFQLLLLLYIVDVRSNTHIFYLLLILILLIIILSILLIFLLLLLLIFILLDFQ